MEGSHGGVSYIYLLFHAIYTPQIWIYTFPVYKGPKGLSCMPVPIVYCNIWAPFNNVTVALDFVPLYCRIVI